MTEHDIRRGARAASRLPGGRTRRGAAALAAALLLSLTAVPASAAVSAGNAGNTGGAGNAGDTEEHARGALLSTTHLADKAPGPLRDLLTANGVDASAVRHGITAHRIVYATVTPAGEPTTASALLVLPAGGGERLATVSETHGTTAYRGYAPSTGDNVSVLGAFLYASGGRAAVAPDYLGLGAGPGTHPYVDTRSSVSASLDALRAARTAARGQGRRLTGAVYATGFSQGGQVAMALGRELARGADRRFRLRALAPVAGPYDIEGVELPAMFDGRIDGASAVFYLSYFLVAQNRLHPLYGDPREVFRAPYADRVEELFDGDHPDEEIAGLLPGTVGELLTDEWHQRLRHPTGTLAEVIRLNDGVCAWAPRVPVRLHTSGGDRDVPAANTGGCVRDLARHGAYARVVHHGDADHFGAYQRAIAHNARWFARLD
ncbi:alpha/beta hydrolase [Streptomyces sp. DH37]|uniref:alpha/beta hydrolase n=1 Tax=Streptomyces sp. DH37 TaxID=3040122 RepID=UPI0024412629|nr:alpha/beta hydrolase [Streptomyces sp. DH37]MDG9704969.1 alpha/beta hydrolase [Streptomyces sp. DH37]